MKVIEIQDNNPFELEWQFTRRPLHEDFTTSNIHVPMRDGTKIAITLCLPKEMSPDQKIPTLLYQTRYWRSAKLRIPFRWVFKETVTHAPTPRLFTQRGYAIVYTDVRGCGASYGSRPYPFSEEEIKDGGDLADWIISQSWSDGNIVSNGISYTGTTAELLASNNHPAVKAVIPGHCFWDPYTDVTFPGGCYDLSFTQAWSFLGKRLDNNDSTPFKIMMPFYWFLRKGVMPIDSEHSQKILKESLQEHDANEYIHDIVYDKDYRDDTTSTGVDLKVVSIFTHKEAIEKLNIPIIQWCSWLDSGYVDAVIHRFINMRNPQIAIIGDWNHGAGYPANPLKPNKKSVLPSPKKMVTTWIDIFDSILFGGGISGKTLYYYTMGEEKWKKTLEWPPKGQIRKKWYLSENNELTSSKPESELGEDNYKVNFRASTGRLNRWWTLLGLPIDYSGRENVDRKLLLYTSLPLLEDIEITGFVNINLYLKSTHEDGAIYAYLEDIDEEGNVFYFTDGNLRLIHRKISSETPPYKTLVPYHSYNKRDAAPVIPGEIMEIIFSFKVTSVLIQKGHRLRLAIAGADKDTFKRYPESGTPTYTIARNASYSSFIDIPIMTK